MTCDELTLVAASRALATTELEACDYQKSLERAGPEDFVFADPPYTVTHGDNGFLLYNEQIFSWEDQLRLRQSLGLVHDRGGLFVLTNADHPSIRRLYRGFPKRRLVRHSILAASADNRRLVGELIVSNFNWN